MTPSRSVLAKQIFERAIEASEDDRPGLVADACGHDRELLREVESLLAHFADDASHLLVTPPAASGNAATFRETIRRAADGPLSLDQRVGRYVIREKIGEGGMSVVYRASQSEPVRRDVALKVLKPGMDSASVLARFEMERQVLASMDHPGIAKVFDAGMTERGSPYFVMELVDGAPLNEFCDQRRLGVSARIDLFGAVCRAIQHAHMRGVIHRDLKPSNILVVEHEGVPVARVIDFGVAKALLPSGGEVHTQLGQPIGTPAYMSPEQWTARSDIDVRSDVYSLGVVLYQLLSGRFPYPFETLEAGDLNAVRSAVERTDPILTSSRISRDGEAGSPVGGVSRAELARLLRGDLDRILLKSISKERAHRYSSAQAFAEDLGRYQDRLPIEARPPSLAYRARKYCDRHRSIAIAMVLLPLGVLAGLGALVYHGQRLGQELDRTSEALERAELAEAEARSRATELEAVVTFQTGRLEAIVPQEIGDTIQRDILAAVPDADRAALRESLAPVNFTTVGLDSVRSSILAPTRDAISEQFQDQPLTEARMLSAHASTLVKLGLFNEALEPLERAIEIRREYLGDEHRETLDAIGDLGSVLQLVDRLGEAAPHVFEALEARRDAFGVDDPDTLRSFTSAGLLLRRQGLYDQAEPYLRSAVEGSRRAYGSDDVNTLAAMTHLARLLKSRGRTAEAETMLRDVLDGRLSVLGAEHDLTFQAMNNLGALLLEDGRPDEAEPHYEAALQGYRRNLGDKHHWTIGSLNNMGFLRHQQGRLMEAERFYRDAMEAQRGTLAEDHRGMLITLGNLGSVLGAQGKFEEAEAYLLEGLDGRRRLLGGEHPATLTAVHNLGVHYERRGDPERAEVYYTKAIEGSRRTLGDGHPDTMLSVRYLANLLTNSGRFADAEPLLLGAHASLQAAETSPERDEQIRTVSTQLAEFYDSWDRPGDADQWRIDVEDLVAP